MARIQANDIEIEYDEFGRKGDPVILLVMGLGMQMIAWHRDFCQLFVDQGFRVVRFDNRDVGLSTHFHELGMPSMLSLLTSRITGRGIKNPPYLLKDMADDTVGLLDALDIDQVHIVGASMGGYISHEVAIHHSHRLKSMTSIMSSTGRPGLPGSKFKATMALASMPRNPDEETLMNHAYKVQKVLSGSKYPPSKEDVIERTKASMARNVDPKGVGRQMAAISASGDRVQGLSSIPTPTLVIHGTEDPLVTVDGGRDTAEVIPNSRLELIDGWGHTMPREVWQPIADLIMDHVRNHENPVAEAV